MVSIFPPNYGLVPIFNISYNSIIEIIETGYSDSFNNKCEKLLNLYYDSIGIDVDEIPFVKRLKQRCKIHNKINERKVDFEDELYNTISFLEYVVNNKETYFVNYVKQGRRLKEISKEKYIQHKTTSISYTPFGSFNSREAKSFIKSSKHLYFDIDGSFNNTEIKKILTFFIKEQLIKASWLSFSKKGFGFIVEANWENDMEMKKSYYKLIEYFTLKLKSIGFSNRLFDTQVCNINRMNFISQNLINKKADNKIYEFEDYSDELYELLHETYKNTSFKELPDKILTDADIVQERKNNYELTDRERIIIRDEKMLRNFLNNITKNLSFSGSNDYNTAIVDYINKVFVFQIDQNLVEEFLFDKIPNTNRTYKKFGDIWRNYSRFSSFQSVEPSIYI